MSDEYRFNLLLISRFLRSSGIIYSNIAFSLFLSLIGLNPVEIAFIATFAILFNLAMSFLLGMLGDRKGYKLELIISEAIAALGLFLIGFSNILFLIELGFILSGFSGAAGGMRGAFSPGSNALIANNYIDDNERARKYALIGSVASLGAIFGSILVILVGFLGNNLSTFRLFYAISFLFILISLISLFLKKVLGKEKSDKIHVAVDRKTHRILNIIVTDDDIRDVREFEPLIEPIKEANTIDNVAADGAYDSEENFRYCYENNINAFIPVRINSVGKRGKHRRKHVVEQLGIIRKRGRIRNIIPPKEIRRANQTNWKNNSGYHMRSLVESTFSVFKNVFGEYTFSKNKDMKEKELLLKAVAYNRFLI